MFCERRAIVRDGDQNRIATGKIKRKRRNVISGQSAWGITCAAPALPGVNIEFERRAGSDPAITKATSATTQCGCAIGGILHHERDTIGRPDSLIDEASDKIGDGFANVVEGTPRF